MKKVSKSLLSLLFLSLLFSCKKDSSTSVNGEIKYEVITSQGTWSGSYFDENGAFTQVLHGQTNWTYIGHPKTKPFVASLGATSDNLPTTGTTTINFYYNGAIVKTTTVNNTTSAFLQYIVN